MKIDASAIYYKPTNLVDIEGFIDSAINADCFVCSVVYASPRD